MQNTCFPNIAIDMEPDGEKSHRDITSLDTALCRSN